MIHREYIVKMPTTAPTTPLDIIVQGYPGSQDAPISVAGGTTPVGWSGSDGAYYELRGRPLRLPVLAAAGQMGGFVPRLNLGFTLSILPVKTAIVTDIPGVQLSQTLDSLASTDIGPTINIPVLADPAYGPVIRLTGGAATAGTYWILHLLVMEAKDEDRSATGV